MGRGTSHTQGLGGRHRVALLAPLLFCLCILAALPAAAGAVGWTEQTTPSSGDNLSGVSFADASHGWAVGGRDADASGVVLATTDAGAHWSAQGLPVDTGSLHGVSFVNIEDGWAVGDAILATSDGGATWAPQSLPAGIDWTAQLYGVCFTDADHGWAVGEQQDGAIIVATTDGGATWSIQSPPAGTTDLKDVTFTDADHGWAVGWSASPLGWIYSHPVVIATIDGGATWTEQTLPTGLDQLFSVSAVDGSHCWVGGTSIILATASGGATWSMQGAASAGLQEQGIHFADVSNGWAVGSDGILATNNGGATWRPQSPPAGTGVVHAVTSIDATHVWAVGQFGKILVTTNGGFLPRPRITRLSPTAVRRGVAVTITGRDFGAKRGTSCTKFGATRCVKYISWSATRIRCRVPAKAKFGKLKVVVVTGGGTSSYKYCTVKR